MATCHFPEASGGHYVGSLALRVPHGSAPLLEVRCPSGSHAASSIRSEDVSAPNHLDDSLWLLVGLGGEECKLECDSANHAGHGRGRLHEEG